MNQYKLSCGYVFTNNLGVDKVEIYKEHNIYHVRRFSKFIDGRLIQEYWSTFYLLKDAKRAFNRQILISKNLLRS